VNPEHGRLGTRSEVVRSRKSWPVGEETGSAKLTDIQARHALELYAAGWFQRQIAEHFGVCNTTIGHLCTGRTWKHLPREVQP
jgi:hypothetical protein